VHLASTAPLPTTVPPGTSLTIAGPDQYLHLQLFGLINTLPFSVRDWPNIGAGPDLINAFRANSLDVGRNAGIPPIQSHYQGGLDARIVAANLTHLCLRHQAAQRDSDGDGLPGKALAFSQRTGAGRGSAAGVQFLTALQAGQVDIAPLGITTVDQSAQDHD
jgi:sulfonate transport system substrate-binding protein